jgi:sialic acid synthase SpsE
MTAIALGAEYIEKHFILEHNDEARDSKVSILPSQMKELCDYRDACELMFSDDSVEPSDDEMMIRAKYAGKWGDNR